jgi:hypothetical protein
MESADSDMKMDIIIYIIMMRASGFRDSGIRAQGRRNEPSCLKRPPVQYRRKV